MKHSAYDSIALLFLFASISCVSPVLASTGCNKSLPQGVQPGKSVDLTIQSNSGVTPRKYRLHLPSSYHVDKEVPLILSFHGRGKDAKFQEKLSQFSNESYGFDGIVAYPEGVPVGRILAMIYTVHCANLW